MPIFTFDDFVFDCETYKLTRSGKQIDLRPKALRLLRLLIENRERVVTKSEIFACVWGEGYARDHLLFQLVSELRKSPFEAHFVRTQPNQGYQWNLPTTAEQRVTTRKSSLVAASFFIWLVVACALYFGVTGNSSPMRFTQLAANSAFSKGILAMGAGEAEQAVNWFQFSLQENPNSVESSLFLAEALLHQKRYREASEYLHSLLLRPNLNSYHKASASDLLSKVYQRQGLLNTALKYALQSRNGKIVAQCSADIIDGRVKTLMEQMGVVAIDEPAASRGESANHQVADLSERYQQQCSDLKREIEETSLCLPDEGNAQYANLIRGRRTLHG